MTIKLLFADDSVTMQKVIQLTLENEDVELNVAGNGSEAIESMKEDRPDIIIADISMPEMDGFELCKEVKNSPETENIPVILISGELEKYDIEKGEAVGANGHITKPFKSEEFINSLRSYVESDAVPAEPVIAATEEADETLSSTTDIAVEEEPVSLPDPESEGVGNVLTLDTARLATPDNIFDDDEDVEIIDYTSDLDDDLEDDLDDLLDEDDDELDDDNSDEFRTPFDSTNDKVEDNSIFGGGNETGDFITDKTEEFVNTLAKGDGNLGKIGESDANADVIGDDLLENALNVGLVGNIDEDDSDENVIEASNIADDSNDNLSEESSIVDDSDENIIEESSIVDDSDENLIEASNIVDHSNENLIEESSVLENSEDDELSMPVEMEGDPLGKNPLLDFQKDGTEKITRVLDIDQGPVVEPVVEHSDEEIEPISGGIENVESDDGVLEPVEDDSGTYEVDFDALLKAAEEHVESVGAEGGLEASEDVAGSDLLPDGIPDDVDIDSMWDDAMKNTEPYVETAEVTEEIPLEADTGDESDNDMDALWDFLQKEKSEAEGAASSNSLEADRSGSVVELESAVKNVLMNSENDVLTEAIRKAVDQSVKSVFAKHIEESLDGEISAMVSESFKSAMPEMIGMVEKITAEITPKIAEEMIKNAIDEIKKGE